VQLEWLPCWMLAEVRQPPADAAIWQIEPNMEGAPEVDSIGARLPICLSTRLVEPRRCRYAGALGSPSLEELLAVHTRCRVECGERSVHNSFSRAARTLPKRPFAVLTRPSEKGIIPHSGGGCAGSNLAEGTTPYAPDQGICGQGGVAMLCGNLRDEALTREPGLRQSPEIADIYLALEEDGYDFA
jgi:hypothetical protein